MRKEILELRSMYNNISFSAGVKISLNKIIDSISTYEDLEKYYVFFVTTFSSHSLPKNVIDALVEKLNKIIKEFKPPNILPAKIDLNEVNNSINNATKKFSVDSLRKYDIIKVKSSVEPMEHYHIVVKKSKSFVYTLCITSKTELGTIPIIKSRIFKGSYFVPTFFVFQEAYALNKFYAIYDSKSEIKNVINYINNIHSTF